MNKKISKLFLVLPEANHSIIGQNQLPVLYYIIMTLNAEAMFYHFSNSSSKAPLHSLHPFVFLCSSQLQHFLNSMSISKLASKFLSFCLPNGDNSWSPMLIDLYTIDPTC